MKKYLLFLGLFCTSILSSSVYVEGYTRSDGTYVEGHYRSSPNDAVSDNYSTDGNINPYTGEEGYRNVDDDAYDYTDGSDFSQTPLETTSPSSNQSDNTALIIGGVILGLTVIIVILRMLSKILFVSYLAANAKVVFWTWVVLTLLNQVVFFGACLQPYCILASIPHVSLITFGIMYLTYKSALTTFDKDTGYNQFGYDKYGYDMNGYGMDGYDRHGYNAKGLDRDGKDRLGKGSISRFLAGSEHQEKISKLHEENRQAQADELDAKLIASREALKAKYGISNENTDRQLTGDPITMNKKNPLEVYKKLSDQAKDVKNFRLYFKDQPTNLVWYGGKIIYVPKDYFLMKNLTNINHATDRKCILYKPDVDLINEMKEKNIVFTLAEDIQELMDRLNASGLNIGMLLSDELGVETISDVDYSEYNGPIYDEDGSWNIKS